MQLTQEQFNRRILVGTLYKQVCGPVCFAVGIGAMYLTSYALGTLMNIYCYGNPDGYKEKTTVDGVDIITF